MGVALYSQHVPSGFNRRAGFDVNTGPIFLQDVLRTLAWGGGGTGDGGHHPTESGAEFHVAGAEGLSAGSELALFPLSVCAPRS